MKSIQNPSPARRPEQAFREAILRFEGAPVLRSGRVIGKTYWQSLDRDVGNWVIRPDGRRVKLGTMYGVTPGALATFLNIDAHTLTLDRMRAITLDEAVEIALSNFYRGPGFDRLPWSPLVEAACDFGWGSGPARAVKSLQRCAGAVADGVIGPATVAAVAAWTESVGWAAATDALAEARIAFYREIPARVSNDGKFTPVWIERAQWFRPANSAWWWLGPSGPVVAPESAEAPREAPKPATEPPAKIVAEGDRAQKLLQIGGLIGTGAAGTATLLQAVPPWASGFLVLIAGGLLAWGAWQARHALRRVLTSL